MKTYTFESCLSVKDFYRGNLGDAFEECQNATHLVRKNVRDEMRAVLGEKHDQVTIVKVTFIEFDSARRHAGAYFHVDIEGPDALIERVEAEQEGDR